MAQVLISHSPQSALWSTRHENQSPLSIVYSQIIQEDQDLSDKILLMEDKGYQQPAGLSDYQEVFDWKTTLNPFQRILHLRDLEENWDSYGAPKFTGVHIRKAFDVYSLFTSYIARNSIEFERSKPFVAPCSDGSVLFEWAGNRYSEKNLEIYIYPPDLDSIEYLKSDVKSGQEVSGELSSDKIDEIEDLFGWLFEE